MFKVTADYHFSITTRRAVGAALLALAASSAFAAGPPAKLTAEQVVEKNIAARGGAPAWRAVQTMSMSGTMDAGQLRPNPGPEILDMQSLKRHKTPVAKKPVEGKTIALPFTMELKRPRMLRLEVEFQGQTAIQVYDGENGFKYRPFLGRKDWQPFTPEELKQSADQQTLDGPLVDYKAKGTQVSLDGMDTLGDHPTYKLSLKLKNGDVRHVWIDAESFLDVKIDGERRMDGKPRAIYTASSDFRKVDGVMVPFLLETSVERVNRVERIHVEKVKINPPLENTRFVKPGN